MIFYHPAEVNERGDVIFNTDLVKMDISIENAEKIFKNALDVLAADMPGPAEGCEYCKWVESCNCS